MKTKLLLILTFCIFSTFLINSQSEEDIIEETSNEKYWKRHFFDLCLVGGPSLATSPYYNDDNFVVTIEIGGSIGFSCGYQYAFTNNFAFGPGFSSFFSIMGNVYYRDVYYTPNNHTVFSVTRTQNEILAYSVGAYSGITFMFMFMFGDLKNKKIAFLLDIGGGHTGAAKLGLYYKGFVFKAGYALAVIPWFDNRIYYGHHITFDLGYKFNWKNQFEGKIFKKNI